MNARIVGVLVVLLVVLGGGALYYNYQERSERADNIAALGKPLLPDLKGADIAAIKIVDPKSTLTIKRQGDDWVIVERKNFPADVSKVRDFVLKMIELKVGQSEPIGDKDRARLNLDQSGTQVEFDAADGKPLGKLVVGKKYFKREVENPDKATADGRFVSVVPASAAAVPASSAVVPASSAVVPASSAVVPAQAGTQVAGTQQAVIVADPLAQASTKSADWIDRTSFQVEKVKTLEVRYASGERWKLERAADNADWKLEGAKPGEKVDTGRANAASYSLSLLELADVAPDDAKDTGLDKPTVITATTLDGLTYVINVGKLDGDNYYVRFTSSGSLPPETAPAVAPASPAVAPAKAGAQEGDKKPAAESGDAERLKKLRERQPREKLLQDYTLLIPKSKLEDTLKPRADLLEKKPEKK